MQYNAAIRKTKSRKRGIHLFFPSPNKNFSVCHKGIFIPKQQCWTGMIALPCPKPCVLDNHTLPLSVCFSIPGSLSVLLDSPLNVQRLFFTFFRSTLLDEAILCSSPVPLLYKHTLKKENRCSLPRIPTRDIRCYFFLVPYLGQSTWIPSRHTHQFGY